MLPCLAIRPAGRRWRVQLAACAGAPAAPPAPPAAPAAPPRDTVTAAAIERVLGGEHRSAEHRARDAYRHPLDTLLFFGIKPEMTVVEVWPGAGGWYTEMLAPLLPRREALRRADAGRPRATNSSPPVSRASRRKLAARPDLYDKVKVTTLGPDGADIAPPGSCDLVVTFRNMHNWMNLGFAPQAFAAMHRALKPGGILGVVEHRGDPRSRRIRARRTAT